MISRLFRGGGGGGSKGFREDLKSFSRRDLMGKIRGFEAISKGFRRDLELFFKADLEEKLVFLK